MSRIDPPNYDLVARNAYNDSEILIIEDSESSSIKLTGLLKKMGFEKIHTAHTAATGLHKFEDLINSGMNTLVFLDFLPETDVISIVKIIHQINVETRVILFSKYDHKDEKVVRMISDGIYRSLKTPITENDINELMCDIVYDESYINPKSQIYPRLQQLLNEKLVITLEDIRNCGIDSKNEISKMIHDLMTSNLISEQNEITQVCCNRCSNNQIISIYTCPACNKPKFQNAILIEHYDCANVTPDKTYVDDKCPSCAKTINALGVDYRILNNFLCLECDYLFSEPRMVNQCINCKNNFGINDASWKISKSYAVVKQNKKASVRVW
mgnify:CR=1 FL=1